MINMIPTCGSTATRQEAARDPRRWLRQMPLYANQQFESDKRLNIFKERKIKEWIHIGKLQLL